MKRISLAILLAILITERVFAAEEVQQEEASTNVVKIGMDLAEALKTIRETGLKPQENIHTVSLYIRPILQEEYFDFVISLEPKRVLFNPGTENHRFNKLLDEKNIYWENSCSLVLLSTNQY